MHRNIYFGLICGFVLFVLFVFVVVLDHSRLKLRRLLSLSFGAYESYLIFDIKNRCGNTSYHKFVLGKFKIRFRRIIYSF